MAMAHALPLIRVTQLALFRDSSDGRSATRSDGRLNGPKAGLARA
jgi:hypothetical protein